MMRSFDLARRYALPAAASALALLGGCASPSVQPAPAPGSPRVAAPTPTDPALLEITDPQQKVAESPRGMVASASKFATAVGSRVLAEGGNAVDAAAATA